MPWNHISAGNIGFNGNLDAGGTVYLDAGKPLPGMFEETIRNLREISPLVFGSAPIAFGWLAEAMERDAALRDNFFAKMRYVGYGGATLSQDIYERIQKLAIAATGKRIPLTTMYGATETQGVTVVHWVTERVGLIGLPLPGITLKLVPNGAKLEVRVKGPTVTPGYLKRPDLTEAAFDEEGYYSLGDAAKFVDESDPEKGLVFDGRVTEDFKLDSGTWVSVGTLRAQAIGAASPYPGLRRLRPRQGLCRSARLAEHGGGEGNLRRCEPVFAGRDHPQSEGEATICARRFAAHNAHLRRLLGAHPPGDADAGTAFRRRPRDHGQGLYQPARDARPPQAPRGTALRRDAAGDVVDIA